MGHVCNGCFAALVVLTSVPAVRADGGEHWAFRKLAAPAVPAVKHTDRVQTPIDAFILQKLEAKELSLAPEAERLALLRRASFDLLGLPPTPEEIDRFLADTAPDAYERLIDRLLASPHYGERWGRHFLDAAGYADTIKTDNDVNGGAAREGLWRFRDYVVRSLNADKPYDRMLLEEIAGDQLFTWSKDTVFTAEQKELLTATGFLRTAVDGTNNYERNRPLERYQVLYDTVEIVSSNVLGLTFACARCHDHKSDPVFQKDYYRLMAFLTPAYNPAKWVQPQFRHIVVSTAAEAEAVKRVNADLDRRAGEVGGKLGALRRGAEQRLRDAKAAAVPAALREAYAVAQKIDGGKRSELQKSLIQEVSAAIQPKHDEVTAALSESDQQLNQQLEDQIADLRARRQDVEKIQALHDIGPAPATHVLKRGNFETPAAAVEPGLPEVLGSVAVSDQRRLALARALTAPDSRAAALVARVLVNRAWHHHFGRGIVATPGNLGRSGSPPTHPELLDWMAAEFIRTGWRLKALHRLLMTSSVYRQSASSARSQEVDPDNQWFGRARLRRLESEIIRDAMLATAGTLDRSVGGPFVAIEGRTDGSVVIARAQPDPAGPRRRSIYLYARRNFNLSLLAVFDQPLMGTNCTCRTSAVMVPQALALLNDATVIELAEQFSRRVAASAGPAPEARVGLAFQRAFGRLPSGAESAWGIELLKRQGQRDGTTADGGARGLAHLCHMLLCANEFIYVE